MWRLALALALAMPLAAAGAEVPKAEVFAGYSYSQVMDTNVHGWQTGFDYRLGRSFGLELSVSRQYGKTTFLDLAKTSLLAGPRYAWRGERLTPFVHALAGIVRTSQGADLSSGSFTETDTDMGGALGAGLDLALGRRWALRIQGDYLVQTRTESRDPHDPGPGDIRHTERNPRAAIGLVYRAGRR